LAHRAVQLIADSVALSQALAEGQCDSYNLKQHTRVHNYLPT